MHPVDIEKALEDMTIIVDTREHPGAKFNSRIAQMGYPHKREKLDFGDYSARTSIDGRTVSLADKIVIERKMDGNELAMCFGRERARFEREFQRARDSGAKIYLLVENENYEKLYAGKYGSSKKFRSKLSPASLMGSLYSWQARYQLQLILCKEEITGKIIRDILYYEMREALQNE